MATHPASLRKQLLLHFEEVLDARFEFDGYTVRFYVKFAESADIAKVRKSVQVYLERNRALGCPVVLEEGWVDGPSGPASFEQLSAHDRRLVEGCSGTESDIQGLMVQMFPWVESASTTTTAPGQIRLELTPRDSMTPGDEDLRRCKEAVALACSLPNIDLAVTFNPVPTEPVSTRSRRGPELLISQASAEGIVDPVVRQLYHEDEDRLRSMRVSSYRNAEDLIPASLRHRSAVLLPPRYDRLDLRSFLPFYDTIFFPVPWEDSAQAHQSLYRASQDEMLALVEMGRCCPLFPHAWGRFSEKTIRLWTEAGLFVTPRTLTALLARDALISNPIWAVAQNDAKLARQVITVACTAGAAAQQDALEPLIRGWAQFSRDTCLDYDNAVISRGTLLPLTHGPGAYALAVFGNNLNALDLETRLFGLEVSHALALNAACCPGGGERAYPLYDILLAIAGQKILDRVEELTALGDLDAIVAGLTVACPRGMSVVEWAKRLDAGKTRELRTALTQALSRCARADLPDIRLRAEELAYEIRRVAAVEARTRHVLEVVDRYDLVGLVSEGALLMAGAPIPFAGWFIGQLIKRAFPAVWDTLQENTVISDATDLLVAVTAITSPHAARLHRLGRELNSDEVK